MATVKVTVKNINRLTSRFYRIAGIDLTNKVKDITILVHGQAKALASVDTGNLAGSIHMEVNEKGKRIEGRVFTNVQYAPYVEFGTGSTGNGTYHYKIKNLKLSYRSTSWVYTPDGGEHFYRTNGQIAQPFLYPAIRRNRKKMKKILTMGLKEKLKEICKGG